VLKLMWQHGCINRAEYQAAVVEKLVLRDNLRHEDSSGVQFKEAIRRQLIDRFGKDAVYAGRLRVYTTIDPIMQRAAEAAVTATLADIESRIRTTRNEPLQAALIALDAETGEVRAMVGGRDISGVGLNRALQAKRQPGSAFKPFVYAAALESGYSPASVIDHLNQPIDTFEGAWLPEDEHSQAASMTLRTALRTSSNRAAVRTLEDIGIPRAVAYAERLGVGTIPNVPSLALGSGEVTLASMTAAYAAFANGGIVRDPVFITRVENQDGAVLFRGDPKPRRAISASTAFLMASMLADVIDAGTAYSARQIGFTAPAGGKTGTTNDFVDAWFVGFTPRLVAGVWVGFDRPHTIVENGFAGQLAVPMWARFMKAATKGDGDAWFDPPSDVVAVDVCRISGDLPAAGCRHAPSIGRAGELTYKSMVYRDYFVRGREPQRTCTIHTLDDIPYREPSCATNAFDALSSATGIAPVVPVQVPAPVPAMNMPVPPLDMKPEPGAATGGVPASLLPPPAAPEPVPAGP
jgi:penicillin-binding protein 1A